MLSGLKAQDGNYEYSSISVSRLGIIRENEHDLATEDKQKYFKGKIAPQY